MNTRTQALLIALVAGSSLLAGSSASAASGTWITDGDGTWTDTANWSGSTIADGSGNTAFFTAELTADRIVTLNGDRTIGNITFTDGTTSSNNLTISGANILSLAGATPTMNVTQTGRTLTIGSEIAGTDGLIKTGIGALALTGVNTYTGATTINRGTLNLGSSTATGSLASTSLILSGGALNYGRTGSNTQSFSTTSLNAAGAASITTTATNTLKLGAISRVSGATINFSSTGTFTTTTTNVNGIIGGWAVHSASDWAVANGNDSAITGLGSYTTLPTTGGSGTVNVRMTSGTTLGGSFAVNSLKLEAPGGDLGLNTRLLTIESGGLLSTGTTQRSITGSAGATRLTAGAGSNYNLIIHQYNSGRLNISAVIGDNSGNPVSVVKAGGNRLDVTGANTYTGATIINSGQFVVNSLANGGVASPLGQSTNAASNLVFNNGILSFAFASGSVSTDRNFTIMAGGASIGSASGGNVLTWSGSPSYDVVDQARSLNLTGSSGTTANTFSGLLADNGTGQLSLTASNTGAGGGWTLSNANTFTGSTTISEGVLILGDVNALQNSYINTTGSIPGDLTKGLRTTFAALNLGGLSGDKDLSTIFSTSSGGYGSVTGITLNVAEANNLSYSGVIDGSRTLTKSGEGTQTLSGSNGYTGATNVNAGTLLINGDNSGATGLISVANGATLGGNGTLGGNLTIAAGADLNLTGATLGSNSTGILSLANGTTLTLGNMTFQDLVGWDWNNAAVGTYELIAGNFTVDWGGTVSRNETTAQLFTNGNKGYFVDGSLSVVVVPEPTTLGLLGLGAAGLILCRRLAHSRKRPDAFHSHTSRLARP